MRQYLASNAARRLDSLTDDDLDAFLRDTLTRFPEFGRQLTIGHLKSQGYCVSKAQIQLSYLRVQGWLAIVGQRGLRQRGYNVIC